MWMFKRTFTCCPSNRLTSQILGLVPTLAHLACLRWKRRKVFPRSNVSVEKPTQRLLLSGKEWAFFCLLLWPLVISKQLGQFHFSASKWKTARLQEVKRYTMHQTEDAFLGKYFFLWHIFWPIAILDNQEIQYRRWNEDRSHYYWRLFVCNLLNCLKSL